MFNLKTAKDLGNLEGKRVLLRADFNVPIIGKKVADAFRIERAMRTLRFLSERGAKTLVVSHIKGKHGDTLRPVFEYLKEKLPVVMEGDLNSANAALRAAAPGEFVLLENIRMFDGEEENSEGFARQLASLADMYINNAFSVSHREHASVVGVPRFLPSAAGFLLMEEVENLRKVFDPPRPFSAIFGGAKFGTKLPLLQKIEKSADRVFVGGALANTFLRNKGYETGLSAEEDCPEVPKDLLQSPKILLPADALVENAGNVVLKKIGELNGSDIISDAGPETFNNLKDMISDSAFALWNGPLGLYEKGFSGGTEKLASMMAGSDAETIIGGGDTIAAAHALRLKDKFSFISTGGGAMLQFLADETLPGIEALQRK